MSMDNISFANYGIRTFTLVLFKYYTNFNMYDCKIVYEIKNNIDSPL